MSPDKQYQAIHPHRLLINGDATMYLRLANPNDGMDLYRVVHANRTHLSKTLAWAKHIDFLTLDSSIKAAVGHILADRWLQYRIIVPDPATHEQRLIGTVTLYDREVLARTAKLSCWIAQAEEGKGFATRAVTRLLHYAFSEWNIDVVTSDIQVGNLRAERLIARVGGVPTDEIATQLVDDQEVRYRKWVIRKA